MAKIPKGTFDPDVIDRRKRPFVPGDPLNESKKVPMPTVPNTPKFGDIPNSTTIRANVLKKDGSGKYEGGREGKNLKKDEQGDYTTSTQKKLPYNPFRKKK